MQNNLRIVCPKCRGLLKKSEADAEQCQTCGAVYHTTFGIPDLRFPLDEVEDGRETAVIQKLITAYDHTDYFPLVDLFFSTVNAEHVPDHLVEKYRDQRIRQLAKGSQMADMFLTRINEHYSLADSATALELGCGSGAGLVALAQQYEHVVALDPSLPQLILAKKFCDENSIHNVTFVQAYGQHLPFLEDTFSYITAQNVLEHVFDIQEVLAEVARVLKPDGGFAADSRNRYDMFFPEPHVHLRGVGFLPRAWANSYVNWRLGINYDAFHTYLLSYGELKRAMKKAFGSRFKIIIPKVSIYGMPQRWDGLLASLERYRWIQYPLAVIFPSHLAIAQK